MPEVIYADQTDEIVDLVEKVRNSEQDDVALVVNRGTVGLQTPLNIRLLNQLGVRAGKTVSVISGDPYVQQLSRGGGLATYASVPAFERGIQTVRPHQGEPLAPPPPPVAAAAAVPMDTYATAIDAVAAPAAVRAQTVAGAGAGVDGPGHRRPLYFGIAALVLLGLVLLLVVAPSAKVSITMVGTPLTASPVIQGSPDAANAGKADHIVTAVVSTDQSSQFQANPSGQKQIPAASANGQIVFQTDLPNGATFVVPKGEEFDTQDSTPIRFYATQDTTVTVPGPAAGQKVGALSNPVPVADGTPEAKGNVAANTITGWPGNPCKPPQICSSADLTSTNPKATAGGADATTQVTASANDVAAWTAQSTQAQQTLTTQVNADLQNKATGRVLAKDPGGNGTTVSCDVTPPLPAADAQFAATQVTVACHGKAAAYTPADVTADLNNDLQGQVGQGDTLETASVTCTKPQVTQAADDGTVVLSAQCNAFSRPNIDLNGLKSQLTGKSAGDAKNVIQHRLDRVQNVSITQSPIPMFWLPFFSSRIEVDESFVAKSGS